MSKSDDNTNELESYGVWVKNTVDNEPSQEEQTNNLDADNETLDLPDFDDTDFSDMFKDDSQFSTDQIDDFGMDTDTTLSTDELANITDFGDVAIENVDAPEITDDISEDIPEMSMDNSEPIFDTEETKSADDVVEETAFNVDDILDSSTEEVPTDEFMADNNTEEEISLDDFLEDGFSDESVASGNNGYEAGSEPKTEDVTSDFTEEVSLDDFLDDASFDTAPAAPKKEETVVDEAPLDMDISFDDSVDNIATEDNLSLDTESIEEDDDNDLENEDISLEDFDLPSENNEDNTDNFVADATSDEIATEEVDLSDFGIDADADETPIVQDVETQKNKEQVVDYDLFIGNESTSSAPVVNEIKNEENNDKVEVENVESEPVQNNTTTVENSLLEQIVADLSSLKDEIKNIKSDINDIKAKEAARENAISTPLPEPEPEVTETTAIEPEDITEPAIEDTTDDLDLPDMDNEGGFFSSDDTDETIALSGDELSNIMNNAEFSENVENSEEAEDEPDVISEEVFDNTLDETAITDDSELTLDNIEDTNDTTTNEAVEIEEPSFDNDIKEDDENLSFNYEDEKLEEPSLEDIEIESNEETAEDLPEEISIPKDEDIFVESTSSDFMDSVKDTSEDITPIEEVTEEVEDLSSLEDVEEVTEDDSDIGLTTIDDVINNPAVEEVELDEVPTVEKLLETEVVEDEDDTFADVSEIADEEPTEETSDDSFATVTDFNNEEPSSEESFADVTDFDSEPISDEDNFADVTSFEEPAAEEEDSFADVVDFDNDTTVVEENDEPVIEETSVSDSEAESTFEEIDNLNNDLSSSNLDYLTTKEDDSEDKQVINGDLKQEIKSVLLYMDQLLENLPEEKIYEFAKSEEFATYKKLFKDLGLS